MKLPLKYGCGILLVLLLATGLGASKLNTNGIWFDEWWSLYVAGADVFHVPRTVEAIWERISNDDVVQGVLYPLTLSAWGSTVGWTEFATRALSLLAGLIALAGVFRLGWALSGRPLVGLSAAALLATSVWFVYFLHEMRVYMLLVMLTVLLLLLYQRLMAWRREPRLRDYAALAIVTGLLLSTHYFAGVVVAVVGLWHLLRLVTRRRPNRRWWGILIAWAFSALAFIPWAINLPRAATDTASLPRTHADAALLLQIVHDTFYAFSNASLALIALLLAFSLLARPARWVWGLLLVVLPLNLLVYYLFSLPELRYNMTTLPLLALLVGFGVDELSKRRVPALLIAGIWATGVFTLDGNFQMDRTIQHWPGQPIREMATVLESRVAPQDVIVNLLGDENRPTLALHPLVYYMGSFGARLEVVENSTYPGTQVFAARVRQAVGDAQRLWLLYDPRWTMTDWGLFEYVLNEENLYHCTTLSDTPKMLIWGYGRIDKNATGWQFGDGVKVSMLGEPRIKDGLLQVWLAYQIDDQVPANTYSVAVHMLDGTGQLRAQRDLGLPAAGLSCQALEIPIHDLANGTYQLHMAVYNWQTGKRLSSSAPDGSVSDYPILEMVNIPAS